MGSSNDSARATGRGWANETEIFREFDHSVLVSDAVELTVAEAVERWPEVTDRRVLGDVVAAAQLDGLFDPSATGVDRPLPTVEFQFQRCDVTVICGHATRVIVARPA